MVVQDFFERRKISVKIMNVSIKLLDDSLVQIYEKFLLSQEYSLLYYSNSFRTLLEKYLGCETYYSIAFNNDAEIVGVFPLAIYKNKKIGKVANSLPFYGSNGGVLLEEKLSLEEGNIVISSLTDNVLHLIKEQNCIAATFITNPFVDGVENWFELNLEFDYLDYRIGQITELPTNANNTEESLLQLYDNPRPRNIRKAIKSGVNIRFSKEKKDLDFLFKVHKKNINSIGGKVKEYQFFLDVLDIMPKDSYDIIIAEIDQESISGLLVFYYNKTVEYFTPATLYEFRNRQPSSLIIHEGMKKATEKDFKYWNWGGTWKNQDGVYDFKKKWGAKDNKYKYYTKIYDQNILNLSQNDLLNNFPNFFVLPFNKLK